MNEGPRKFDFEYRRTALERTTFACIGWTKSGRRAEGIERTTLVPLSYCLGLNRNFPASTSSRSSNK